MKKEIYTSLFIRSGKFNGENPMKRSQKLVKALVLTVAFAILAAPAIAGNGRGPGDGTGNGGNGPGNGGNGPGNGDCLNASVFSIDSNLIARGGNGNGGGGNGGGGNGGGGNGGGGNGAGDGTGNGGNGPADGSGPGPRTGDCLNA